MTGRLQDLRTTIDSVDYTIASACSPTTGCLDSVTYPTSTSAVSGSRLALKYQYAYGRLKRVRDTNGPLTTYWEQVASDARGNASEFQLGNRLHTYSTFDAVDAGLRGRTTGHERRHPEPQLRVGQGRQSHAVVAA